MDKFIKLSVLTLTLIWLAIIIICSTYLIGLS